MSFRTVLRPLTFALVLFGLAGSVAFARSDKRTEAWISAVVSKIAQAERGEVGTKERGSVTIRLRIGADGVIEGAAVEASSGSAALDERALRAVKAAAPFAPPPPNILTLEGFTELAFPVEVGGTATR